MKIKNIVSEGDVVAFPKKHKGDLASVNDCPKCGGDLQGGKYMGHEVKVCMPCKQVYLPPNSGIDQKGNKITDEGFDYTMKDLGNDYAGFPSNHSLKHKFLAKIKPEKQQLYKDKMNNMHEFDQLFQLFTVAKQRGDIIEQGVAEGLNDTVYPNAEVIKSKNGKPVGEIYQDESGWGCFHYKADNGADSIESREQALEWLKDIAEEYRQDRSLREQGVAEESTAPTKYRATVEYGPTAADAHFVTVTATSTEEAEAKVQKWCEKKGVRNPMITINGADKPVEEAEQQKGADYRDPPEADYGDDYQDMVARVKKLAGMGPLKTVYDPAKRVYKNVPTAVQLKK